MKRITAIIFALIILCALCTGCSNIKADDITYTGNKEIIVCTPSSISKEAEKIFSKDREELKQSMEKSGILLSGVYKDRSCSFTVLCETTKFSENITDLTLYSQSELDDIATSLVPDYISYFRSQNALYIYSEGQIDGNEKALFSRQYITVKNGKLYVISFTASDKIDEEKMASVMNSIAINENNSFNVGYIIMLGVAILIIVGLIIFIIISIIKDLKDKE